MSKIKKIKPSTLTKILLLILFITSGALVFLLIQLGTKNSIQVGTVSANEYPYACGSRTETGLECDSRLHTFEIWCNNENCNESPGNCVPRNVQCVSANNNPELPQCSSGNYSAGQCKCGENICYIDNPTCNPSNRFECIPNRTSNCRYRTGGGHCAQSEFDDCDPGEGEICVCSGYLYSDGTWTYSRAQKKPISEYMDCGIDLSPCNDPRNNGRLISEILGRTPKASRCDNPWDYRCPGSQNGQINVRAVCDGNIPVSVTYEVARNAPDAFYQSGTTNSSVTGTVEGRDYNVINRDDNGSLNDERERYPNISLSGSRSVTVPYNGSVIFNYTGCSTNPPSASECIGISSNRSTLSPGQSAVVTMQVRNVENNEGRLFIYNRGNRTCDGVGVPCPAYIPARESDRDEQGQPINSPIRIDSTQKRYFVTSGDNLNPVKTYRWTITYEQLFGTSSTPIVDAYNNQVLRDVQLNGYTWGLAPHGYDPNCVTSITQSLQPPSPNIEVSKTLVSPNFQPVGSTITFNINARNTGNVDIRNFTLSDQYDPNYLEFVSSTYRGQTLNPDTLTGTIVNGRRQLTWSNMPPKSGFSGEDGVLTAGPNGNGETFTLTLTFRILREVTPILALENDNCGIITTITYRDELGQDRQDTLNPPRQSCAEFDTPTEVPLTVQVNKTTLTPSVVSPTEVRFRATITNNDSNQRTYSDIDFTDVYDATYLRPNRVIVTNPSGLSATVSGFTLNGSLVIQNLQDLCSGGTSLRAPCNGGGTPLGALPYNQTYILELIYDPRAPVSSTCDEVFANVTDTDGNGGVSNRARACAEITAPPPPITGSNGVLNLILPGLGMISAGIANFVIRRKFD